MENFDMLRGKVEKMVKDLGEKPDLTPTEIKNATDAMCLLHKINEVERGNSMRDQYGEGAYAGYSGYGHHMMPYMGYEPEDSYGRRMRSSVTGRYMAGNQSSGNYGHSIKDRMVAQLEEMMDQAKTEYERQEIQQEIQKLRMNNMI